MAVTTQALREWLGRRYGDYSVEMEPKRGAYGVIWFLTANSVHPRTFAVKTIDPEKIVEGTKRDNIALLRREFRMWLALPQTYNVLPALGFDVATLSNDEKKGTIDIPIMRMPRMMGSLKEWVGKATDDQIADRLLALAQALNGLQYLYDHGFEGHGDLKPENLLYDDLRDKFRLVDQASWPASVHPWRVRVADLGWADAWIDLGYNTKAYRLYLAPERLDGRVVPIKSDMFSMGVIASELLQGCHPAENPKRLEESEGKWRKWAESSERNLKRLLPPRLRRVVERSLDPNPDARPNALEFLDEVCAELKSAHGLDVVRTLSLWRSAAGGDDLVANYEHVAWAAAQSSRLGAKEVQDSCDDILRKMSQLNVIDFESLESWAPLAQAYVDLAVENPECQSRIRTLAAEYLTKILGTLDKLAMTRIPCRNDWKTLREFERFSMLVGRVAEVVGINAIDDSGLVQKLGRYAKSALYFARASDFRMQNEHKAAREMLSLAIAEAPDESTNYYFLARWTRDSLLIEAVGFSGEGMPDLHSTEDIVRDLDVAIQLDPDWEEPGQLRQSLKESDGNEAKLS